MESKFWKDMFVENGQNEGNTFIISKEKPISYGGKKNIKVIKGLEVSEYDEFCSFIQNHNKMSTGNTTLLPKSELVKLLKLDNNVVLIRSNVGNKLIGTIMTIKLPIRNKQDSKCEIITHGCTTFLSIHSKLRGNGLCMALIRGLVGYGYEEKVYCDYHTVPLKIGNNSIKVNSWYRPIHLQNSTKLGFLHSNTNTKTRNRLKYKTNLQKGYSFSKITNTNSIESLNLYKKLIKNKKFVFYPDIDLWKKWINIFPSFIIYKENVEIGIVSLHTLYCII